MRIEGLLPRVEPHERARLGLASLAFVGIAAGALMARTAGDALFLSAFGSGPLPFLYVAGSLLAAAGALACVGASRRFRTGQIALAVAALLGALHVAIYAALPSFPSLARAGAYLAADLTVRLPVLLFWGFASELFDPSQSRRLFGVVGAAGTLACLPAGLLAGPFARRAGTESLLVVAAALLAASALALALLVRGEKGRRPPRRETLGAARAASARRLRASRAFQALAVLAVVTSVVETLVDYQFKTLAASAGGSHDMAALFGMVYAAANLASLFLQLLVVHRLLTDAGLLAALVLLPAGLLVPLLGLVRFASMPWSFAAKALDVSLATSVNGTARQLLYRGVRRESRLTARALAEGLLQPLAIGLAGAGLALASGAVPVRAAAAAAAAGCLVWLLGALAAHRTYVAGLLDALRARSFGSTGETLLTPEREVGTFLRRTLSEAPDDELVHLAAVLPLVVRLAEPRSVRVALARAGPEAKAALLEALHESRMPGGAGLAREWLKDSDAEVRRAAVLAACDAPAARAGSAWLEEMAEDRDARVRASTAAGLARARDRKTRILGLVRFHEGVFSPSAEVRVAAAEALEQVGTMGGIDREVWIRYMARLLGDPDEAVAAAALETLRRRPDATLAGPVLDLLSHERLTGAAVNALLAMGDDALEAAVEALERLGPGSPARRALLSVLERWGDPRARDAVKALLPLAPFAERAEIYRAVARLSGGSSRAEAAEVDRLVLKVCRAASERRAVARRLGDHPALSLLRDALLDLHAAHVANAFALLAARVPEVDMEVLHARLTREEGEARAQTLELLRNVLPPAVREALLSAVEERGGEEGSLTAAVREIPALLLDTESDWVVAGAAWVAGELPLPACAGRLEELRENESAVVRETALHALARLGRAA